MRKLITIFVISIMTLTTFSSCSPKQNAKISSEWKLSKMIYDGKTTYAMFSEDKDALPQFTTDGKNFTFSFNGKTRNGVILENGSSYELDFEDVDSFFGTIEGNKFTVTVPHSENELIFIFEAK